MKTLNRYINETLTCLHSKHINEWKANNKNVSSIWEQYFVYKIDENEPTSRLKIISNACEGFKTHKNNVYVNGKRITLDPGGYYISDNFSPGIYNVLLPSLLENITNCFYMFYGCENLISVPFIDTSKVHNMYCMFKNCERLQNVPLFNTSKVKNMSLMFYGCNNLNEQTKQEWSQIYDFEKDDKK